MDIFMWGVGIGMAIIGGIFKFLFSVNDRQDKELDSKAPLEMMLRYETKNENAHDNLAALISLGNMEQTSQGKDIREIKTILQERFKKGEN